jgi:hypothetical protein
MMVRISSRTWTLTQIEHLTALISAGSTAENAAIVLRRSVVVVRAKARSLRMHFARAVGEYGKRASVENPLLND